MLSIRNQDNYGMKKIKYAFIWSGERRVFHWRLQEKARNEFNQVIKNLKSFLWKSGKITAMQRRIVGKIQLSINRLMNC